MVGTLHDQMIKGLDPARLLHLDAADSRKLVEEAVLALITAGDYPVYGEVRLRLVSLVADEVLGLGPIQKLVDDPTISEVMVNGPETVYFEREGVIHLSDVTFRDEPHVRRVA